MRLIDADELKRSLSVSEILETRESLEQIIDAQPTIDPGVDEWCPDCKEYDSQRHMCPRFNRVIRETLNEVKTAQSGIGWIPCSERLPEDVQIGDEYPIVIFCTKEKTYTGFYEYYLGGRWWTADGDDVVDGVIAWKPLPKPYEGGQDEVN